MNSVLVALAILFGTLCAVKIYWPQSQRFPRVLDGTIVLALIVIIVALVITLCIQLGIPLDWPWSQRY